MDHHDVRRALKKFESERVETPTSVEATWNFRFDISEDEDDGGWVARCIDLPGCWVQGDTIEELRQNMESAVAEVLAVRLHGEDPEVPDLSGLKVAAAH